jgi:hypothetical protein
LQQLDGEVVEIEVTGGVTEEAEKQEEDGVSDGTGQHEYEHGRGVLLGLGHDRGRMMRSSDVLQDLVSRRVTVFVEKAFWGLPFLFAREMRRVLARAWGYPHAAGTQCKGSSRLKHRSPPAVGSAKASAPHYTLLGIPLSAV